MDEGRELINRLEALGLRGSDVGPQDGYIAVSFEILDKLLRRVEASLRIDYDKEPSLPLRADQWESVVSSGGPPEPNPERPWWLLQVIPTEVKSWPGEPLRAQAVCLWVRQR